MNLETGILYESELNKARILSDGIRKCKRISPEYLRIDGAGHGYNLSDIENAYNWMLWNSTLADLAEEVGITEVVEYHRKWARLWLEKYQGLKDKVV